MIKAATVRELYGIQKLLGSRLRERSGEQAPEGLLYHYTDSSGLLGIIKSRTLWATHSQYLNDSSEFIYASSLLKKVAAEAAEGAPPGSARARLSHSILERSEEGEDRDESKDGDESEDGDESGHAPALEHFVTCFSERGDGLSQWRGYGKSLGGYSVGFPFEHLRAIEDATNRKQAGQFSDYDHPRVTAEVFRCWYDKTAQKQLIQEAFERLVSYWETRGEHPDDKELALFGRAILRPISGAYKDPAFVDEREWRLVIQISRPSRGVAVAYGASEGVDREKPRAVKENETTVEFRSGEFTLIPYVTVPLDVDGSVGIAKVIVGPTPLPEIARQAASRYLRKHVPQVKVASSEIPFRRV